MFRIAVVIFYLFSLNISFSKETQNNNFVLNEKTLIDLLDNKNPTLEKINSLYQQSIINELNFKNNYNYKIYGNINYTKADDDWSQWDYSGTNDETNFSVGLQKNSMYGINGNLSINGQDGNYYTSGLGNQDIGRNGLMLTYSIDLWKNFLGYQDLTRKLNLDLNKKQSQIKTYIEKNNFYYSLRNIYWNLVIKNKELKFYNMMLEQAKANLINVEKKFKAYIADSGDLAQAKASVELRKTQYKNIEIEIINLKKELQNYLPELLTKNIVITSFDLTNTFNNIAMCNNNIYNNKNDYTTLSSYKEYIDFMDKIIDTELKMLKRDSDFDVKLDISANFRGIDKNINKSFKDLREFDRDSYSVGLNISKNLGNNDNELKINKIKLTKMNYYYNKNNTLANMSSFYNSYQTIMENMFENLNNLSAYKKNMNDRVKNSRKKYNQGRLALSDLIQDEDNLVDANIKLIEMEGVIINTILQYLSIFDKTECTFNLKVNN